MSFRRLRSRSNDRSTPPPVSEANWATTASRSGDMSSVARDPESLCLGRRHCGKRVLILVADLEVRVITEDGDLLRSLTLDPARDYQLLG